jgi:hypothetical protein
VPVESSGPSDGPTRPAARAAVWRELWPDVPWSDSCGRAPARREAVSISALHLLGASAFRAGLFADDQHAELSAVIFSNACSIAKLNRVTISAGAAPKGLRYMPIGKFFDRSPGALEGIPFCLFRTACIAAAGVRGRSPLRMGRVRS